MELVTFSEYNVSHPEEDLHDSIVSICGSTVSLYGSRWSLHDNNL
jgi:hypothetical protein